MVQRIDPWSSTQYADYGRLREQFGIEAFEASSLPSPPPLFRRGIIFGQRGYGSVSRAIAENRRFCVLTGLAPSGRMHFGHKMVIDEVLYYMGLGADIFVAVADIEAYSVRGLSMEECRRLAVEEYLLNYVALGLSTDKCQFYFQSKRHSVKDLAYLLGVKTNISEMKAIYGFVDSTNMGHVFAPLVQVGDILHVQLEEYGGPRPTIVPVGVDQDPHIRLTRKLAAQSRLFSTQITSDGRVGIFVRGSDNVERLLDGAESVVRQMGFSKLQKIPSYKALYVNDAPHSSVELMDEALSPFEREQGGYGFLQPASTYHRFMTGLDGGKMSSSKPDSAIFLTDTPKEAGDKLKRAKTGGKQSVEEQKKFGGDPSICSIYEMMVYHLSQDDREVQEMYDNCTSGKLLCGECKKLAAERAQTFLSDMAEKREMARDKLDDLVVIP